MSGFSTHLDRLRPKSEDGVLRVHDLLLRAYLVAQIVGEAALVHLLIAGSGQNKRQQWQQQRQKKLWGGGIDGAGLVNVA